MDACIQISICTIAQSPGLMLCLTSPNHDLEVRKCTHLVLQESHLYQVNQHHLVNPVVQ